VAGTILGQSRGRESIATIHLTEVETGRLVWSETVGLEPGDGPSLNRIATRFARAVAIQIRTAESRRPLPPRPGSGHYAMIGHAVGQDRNTAATVAEALSLFQKALAMDDASSSALHGLAWARLVQVNNWYIPVREHPAAIAEAKLAIDRLLARDPRNPATHFLRANMFRASKEIAEAIAAYEYTLSLNPNHQWAHASLGRVMIEVGQAKEAISKIEFAIRLHPSDPLNHSAYHWAGMAALHVGYDHAAVEWLLKARLANPDYAYAMLWLAMAYCAVDDMEKARANLAEHAAIRPGVSIKSFRRNQATSNPVVAEQRERLVGLLRKLGVAEDNETTVGARE
jgi:tetratricopeptide (TPR) repeat protein